MSKEKKKKKTAGDVVRNIIMIIALAVFLFSGYQLLTIFMEYKAGTDEYKEIAAKAFIEVSSEEEEEEDAEFQVDFDLLSGINEDVVAWIKFEQPDIINYPIVQGIDNDYYLTHTFERNINSSGAIFMDAINEADFSHYNTFIYGHNMKNGSMFGKLKEYRSREFWESYPYFYIYTKDQRVFKCEIFSAYVTNTDSDTYTIFYAPDDEYQAYLDMIKGFSAYNTGVEVTGEDRIVSLSTCTAGSEDERYLVHARIVTEE